LTRVPLRRRHWLERLSFHAYLLVVLALSAEIVVGLVRLAPLAAALAVFVLAADFIGTAVAVCALVLCVLVHAYVLAGLGAIALVSHEVARIAAVMRPSLFDPAALTATVAALPARLFLVLREFAGEAPITTRELVLAAREHHRWGRIPLRGKDPGAGAFDGPLLADGRGGHCSQYAAEAIGLAEQLAQRLERSPDVELLATCGVIMPLSAASEWVTDGQGFAEADLRLRPDTLVQALGAFTGMAAGADIPRRVELVTELPGVLRGAMAREQLAKLSRTKALRLRLLVAGITAFAVLRVLLSLSQHASLWLARLPVRVSKALGGAIRKTLRGSNPVVFADVARTAAARADFPCTGSIGGRRPRWLAPWGEWTVGERVLWLFARPILAVASIVCGLAIGGVGWAGGVLLVAASLVRPLRRRVVALAVALAMLPLSILAAAILVTRVAIGELALLRLGQATSGPGGARARGLGRVVSARLIVARRVTGASSLTLKSAREAFAEAALVGDEDKVVERAFELAIAAWAEARPRELLRIARIALRGAAFGQWTGATGHTSALTELRRLYVLEGVMTWAVRWGGVLIAAAAGAVFFPHHLPLVGGGAALARIAAVLATLFLVVPLSERRPSFLASILGGLVAWALEGTGVVELAGVAVVAALLIRLLRRSADRLFVAGRRRWQNWPMPKGTPWRLRRHWRAASEAIESGREAIGIEMLRSLASDTRAHGEFVATVLGRLALLEVERGNLDAAARVLETVSERFKRMPASAAAAAGMLSASLGDLARAELLLSEALEQLDERSSLTPRTALALSGVLGRRGRTDDAMAVLSRQRARPLAIQGLDAMLDVEGAIAATLAAEGQEKAARERLDEALKYLTVDGLYDLGISSRGVERLRHAEGRMLLLRGRLALDAGDSIEAEPLFLRADELLSTSSDGTLRATARVLLGLVLLSSRRDRDDALESVRTGLAELELRRTRLREGDRRRAMIVAGERIYELALHGLVDAERHGLAEAGVVAGTLIESLRSSAIAVSLRSGPLPLGERATVLIERIDASERAGSDVQELRAELGREVSERFAAAYLPAAATPERLRAAARLHGHVLAYFVAPGGASGWCVWIAPDGTVTADGIALDAWAATVSVAAGADRGFAGAFIHTPLNACAQAWERLAQELLPAGLRSLIAATSPERPERILIIPDNVLSFVPWAALHVGGEPLVHRAVLQISPSLELSSESRGRPPTVAEHVVAHLGRGSKELEPLAADRMVAFADTREQFVAALRSQIFGGAYMAMHGRHMGLRQRVEFSDGSMLSAATALGWAWPPWTIFASCLVGRVEHVAGQEPLGLAISCMLGGADTVVASVIEITDSGAAEVCGRLAGQLAGGRHPADALRDAQRSFLASHKLATAASALGLVCISTLPRLNPGGQAPGLRRSLPG
jgi:tetratricopeptide (TPR) repeat protein